MLIKRDDVPLYLQKGWFFTALDVEDEERFTVPDECMKETTAVGSLKDVSHILRSVRYWGEVHVPESVFLFLLDADFGSDEMDELVADNHEYEAYFNGVWAVKWAPANEILSAISHELGVNIVRVLHEKGFTVPDGILAQCAASNDLPALKYFHTLGWCWEASVIEAAAREGHLECLQYAYENGCVLSPEALSDAAEYGQLAVVKHLLPLCPEEWRQMSTFTSAAAYSNCLEVLQYLYEQGYTMSEDIGHSAASSGSLRCLQYLHDHSIPIAPRAAMSAAVQGHLECLKFLHSHSYPISPLTTLSCAQFGQVECMKFARESGCPWVGGETQALLARQEWAAALYTLWH